MMAKAKNGRTINGNWVVVWALVISIGFMMSLIHPQKAYADKKKITGTAKGIDILANTRIPVPKSPVKGTLEAVHLVLDSTDPDWNKASFFYILYMASTGEWNYRRYGVITHPGGDQTFIQFEEKKTAMGSVYKADVRGFFLKGTGKFKGIKGRWNSNWIRDPGKGGRVEEWEVEYEIK